jgi:hypothetical protein
VAHDSNNAGATAVVKNFTANPTGLGTAEGNVGEALLNDTQSVSGGPLTMFTTTLYDAHVEGQPITLRTANENLAVNMNADSSISTVTSGCVWVTWTEE